MMTELTFTLKLLSDYHVGAGYPLGAEIDSALLRDDKVPVLRGTTLTGLLRDSLWRLLQLEPLTRYRRCQRSGKETGPRYCGEKEQPDNFCPLCYLLGAPYLPKRWRVSSARPTSIESPTIRKGWGDNETDSQKIYRVRVNPRTKRASAKQLFSQENGDGRLEFQFKLKYVGQGQPSLDEMALLVAAIRHIREFGRSRRRGQGTCQIHFETAQYLPVQDWQQTDFLDHFKEHWLNHQVVLNLAKNDTPHPLTIHPANWQTNNAVRIRLIVRTDEPLVLARRGEAGSHFETQPFIAGTRLRGAFAGQIVNRNQLADPETYTNFVTLFFRNYVQFDSLYPVLRDDQYLTSAIPAPKDFLTCKIYKGVGKNEHGAKGFAGQPPGADIYCSHEGCKNKKTPLQTLSGFISIDEGRLREVIPVSRSEMHQQINPYTQRVDEDKLFGYTVLETGQYFVGEMRFQDRETWSLFQQMAGIPGEAQPFTLYLGKALWRGYGKVAACWQLCQEQVPHIFVRLPLAQRINNSQQILTMTLLTDAIITDEWGRYFNSFECSWLEQWLGLQIEPESLNVFAQNRLVDGFNTHLGLSRPRDVALVAGTAVGFKLLNPPTDWQKRLIELEQKGIGIKRSEGFGQIVFNHPIYADDQARKKVADPLKIPDGLKLLSQDVTDKHNLRQQALVLERWSQELKRQNWQACRDERFFDISRWLHANVEQPLTELRRRIVDPKEIKKALDKKTSLEQLNQQFKINLSLEEYQRLKKQASKREIADQLEHLGLPDRQLIERITLKEYGTRYKASRIEQNGLDFILKMLNKLEDESEENENYRILGLKMLADHIAAEAKLARKENNR